MCYSIEVKQITQQTKHMTNFKIGDRVQTIESRDKRFNKGTVTAIHCLNTVASVAFDGYGIDVSFSFNMLVKAV